MDNQYLYIILTIVILYILYTKFYKTETFTESENLFADKLLVLFKKAENPNFLAYLERLNEIENIYDNLVSKSVYNKLVNKVNLTREDILKEIDPASYKTEFVSDAQNFSLKYIIIDYPSFILIDKNGNLVSYYDYDELDKIKSDLLNIK